MYNFRCDVLRDVAVGGMTGEVFITKPNEIRSFMTQSVFGSRYQVGETALK